MTQPLRITEEKAAEPEAKKLPTITVTLDPAFYAQVIKASYEDDRPPSNWLKRFIQQALRDKGFASK